MAACSQKPSALLGDIVVFKHCHSYRIAHHRTPLASAEQTSAIDPRRPVQAPTTTTTSQPQHNQPKNQRQQSAYRRWRGMSETYHSTFGQQIFTDASASGNSSGRDRFEMLDATTFYHNDRDYQAPGTLRLSGQDSNYAHGHPFAYASHSGPPSLSSLPPMATHLPSQFETDVNILDDLQGFSPVTAAYNMNANAYRTPYPDSNATSTSSATSPDPQMGLLADTIVIEADEDKRKRNQAASARFRQKKKQREQHLLETSREMQEKTRKLESENEGLRKENLFLKKLLVEKVDHMSEEDREMLLKATGEALKKAA